MSEQFTAPELMAPLKAALAERDEAREQAALYRRSLEMLAADDLRAKYEALAADVRRWCKGINPQVAASLNYHAIFAILTDTRPQEAQP